MNLRAIRADAMDGLEELFAGFRRDAEREELLRFYRQMSHGFVSVAVTTLLLDGQTQFFQLNLARLAENGVRLLRLFRSRGLDLPPASEDLPLRTALTVGDFARADAIATLSRATRTEDEYEGEFLWARVLQLLSLAKYDVSGLHALLDQLAAADEDYEDRVAACRALLARDARAFEHAMFATHGAHGQKTEERAASFTTPAREFAPFRFVWIEGLALLRLGERAGVSMERDLRYCPHLARVPMAVKYEGDWTLDTLAA
jgi:hypothetical protein